jgi:putative transcriptional regulator
VITHHPSEATLGAYATGTLPQALALVAATHLGGCKICQDSLAVLEATGGVLLEDLSPAAMPIDALHHLFGRLDEPVADPLPVLNPDLPAPLNRVAFGRWWTVGIGIRYRPLRASDAAWGGLVLAKPGRSLPRHGHKGLELTSILSGSFTDDNGVYGAGDLADPDADHDRPPVVVGPEPCLCVIASEGMRLRGLLGWAQRMTGH